ncbi:glycosyltransferase family 39 protein [Streptomyces smyrnaeus]|uniref:glycosyltransferase family 39 protein n=1 Tax=Streptomyces TaxID=1883 RepID=UPI000C1A03A8|nr:glycosyltransferase family 39 protein [Streptomyces sp. RK75]MBQ0864116.1 glycosyltransferase family 39 protein [Streptomyces sp. RK75]MBQ1158445.1 glycosyltransferase family 39 protein [Streptomyces sp. A73]
MPSSPTAERHTTAASAKEPAVDWTRLVVVLTALTVLTRLPSFARTPWNPDEGYLATQARQLADGGVLYDTVVDRKPPFVPLLYRGAFAVFGDDSLWPLRVAAIVAVLVGAVLAASIAARRWGERAAWTAGVCYVFLTVGLKPEDTQAATFEVFMLPWTVAAIWYAERARWLGAGLAVAGAVLSKQTGGAVLLPVLVLLWQSRAGWAAFVRVSAAAALPVVSAAFAFDPGRFLYWIATGSGSYLSADGAGIKPLLRALAGVGLLTLAALPLVVALVRVVRSRAAGPPGTRAPLSGTADLWVWFAASLGAATVGFQFFGHYFLQLVPPLALLGAAALHELTARAATAALAATALVACGYVGWGFTDSRAEVDHARRLADTVRSYTDRKDRVLLWGMHPEGYWLSQRSPASRYLTAGFLTNFSGGRGEARVGERYAMEGAWPHFERELRRRPPELIVDDSRGKRYGVQQIPTLRRHLARHYEKVATIDGSSFYLRNSPKIRSSRAGHAPPAR